MTSREEYIQKYAPIAMEQMRQHGIPASIILAQGILESANGKSMLATTANNHFGVKGSHQGQYVTANDDKPGEHFRKYPSVADSYEDHSQVLLASRYQKYVADLPADDYRGWAAGIKQGGYASDPDYVKKLVSLIESNNLQQFDQQVMQHQGEKTTQIPKTRYSTGMDLPQGNYSMPLQRTEYMLVTSPYGQRKDPMNPSQTQIHHGMDIQTRGDAILATEDNGRVIQANHNSNTAGGKTVTVEYTRQDGSKTQVQYMHLSQIDVKVGDEVNAGQRLGITGNTGTRTTGEHLHLGVIQVDPTGKLQWVNTAAYLAEINQKGRLEKQALYNGKDLLADYEASQQQTQEKAQETAEKKQEAQHEYSPQDWIARLFGSSDSAIGTGGLLQTLMNLLAALLTLGNRLDNRSTETKMQAITDAAVNRSIDLSSMVPTLQSARLTVSETGRAQLYTDTGTNRFTHELTPAEYGRLSQILASEATDREKQQRIGNLITGIAITHQASQNYEDIMSQGQGQTEQIKR